MGKLRISVRWRIVLLVAAATSAFLTALHVWNTVQAERLQLISLESERDMRRYVRRLLELKADALEACAEDHQTIDGPRRLEVYGVSALWRFDAQRKLVSKVTGIDGGLLSSRSLPPQAFANLETSPSTYFFISDGKGVSEVFGYRQDGTARYIFCIRHWGPTLVGELETMTGAKVAVQAQELPKSARKPQPGETRFSIKLPSLEAIQPSLTVQSSNSMVRTLQESAETSQVGLVLFSAALLGVLALGLFRMVTLPLRSISTALKKQDPKPVAALTKSKTEFGELASLIEAFFEQQRLLQDEIAVRKRTEAELREAREQLEERVRERTAELARANEVLTTEVAERKRAESAVLAMNNELMRAYDATIEGWSLALDLRDNETEGHTRRVTEMTVRFAKAAGVDESRLIHIRRGALLHDIGKMGIPDSILKKGSSLTDEEREIMDRHPSYAYEWLSPIDFLRPALEIPYCHHERWDGNGYPQGLAGEDIPLAARLFSLVDVWDALRVDRAYRRAWPEAKVREHIRSLAGTHFDPELTQLFLELLEEEVPSDDKLAEAA